MRRLFVFLVLFASFCSCLLSWAQMPTAILTGVATDPQGAVVSGAKVTLTNPRTGETRAVITGSEGRYTFPHIIPGNYDLRVEAKGFAAREFKNVTMEVGRTETLDVQFQVAPEAQIVTVSGGEAQVELTQSEVQGQINATTVENIPLNGRNYLELAFLLPGNRPATNYDPTKTNTLEVSSAGQFGRGNNLTVDGGSNVDSVVGGTLMNFPQDSIGEFQIVTNRYTAEVGNSASSIINIVSKSGTNALHGSLFAFVRNRKLDARSAVEDRTKPQPPFDRQQFGGSFGGPIKKDRIWWFVSGEDRNQHAAIQVGERDFATKTVSTTGAASPLDDLLTLGKLDFKLSNKDDFYVRYGYNRSIEVASGSLVAPIGTAAERQKALNRFNSFYGNWTRTISSHLVNTLVENTNTFVNNIPSFSANGSTLCAALPGQPQPSYAAGCGSTSTGLALTPAPAPGQVVPPALVQEPAELRFPGLQDGANFRIPQETLSNTYEIKDDLTWTKGAHTLHFGGRVQKQTLGGGFFDRKGSDPISLAQNFATQDLNGDGVINDLDIPLSGVVLTTAPVRPPPFPPYANTALGGYIQDDWKILRNLTLNIGLRYEFDTNVFGNNQPFQGCPTPLTTPPTQPCVWVSTFLGTTAHRDTKDFGPRFGFVFDPFKKGTTVIRGGYGIYYDPVVLEVELLEELFDNRRVTELDLPGSICSNVGGNCTKPGARFDAGTPTLAAPYPTGKVPPGSGLFFFVDPNAHHPLVQAFTLGVQHQLGQTWVVSTDALHNYGTRFIMGKFLDNSSGKFVRVTDPLTGVSSHVFDEASVAKTWYDGLLVSVQKRPSRLLGLDKWQYAFNANYTLSKSFNYENDDQIAFNVNLPVGIFYGFNDPRLEKGFAPTDERHRFTLYGVLNAPFDISISPILTVSSSVPMDSVVPSLGIRLPILGRDGIGRTVKNGQQLNSVIQAWNALPLCGSPGAPAFPCNLGTTDANGNLVPLILPTVNPNLTFGDNFASLDFRLTKGIRIAERHKVDLIAEAFNIFNVTNIRGINNNNYSGRVNDITDPTFYKAVSTAGGFFGAGGPRAFQFAVRYAF